MQYLNFGTLTVKTKTAGGALPIAGCNVRVYGTSDGNRDVIRSVKTDRDGISPSLKLPAPQKSLSESPRAPRQAYGLYAVEVTKTGYYTKKYQNVAIFESVETVLPVSMIPREINSDNVTYPRDNLYIFIEENQFLE